MNKEDLAFASAVQLAHWVRARQLSAREVVETFLERIARYNPLLNAYLTVAEDSARRAAEAADTSIMNGAPVGPLHGVPVSIKDLLYTRGIRTTGGSRVYDNFIPQESSLTVTRLEQAGAIVIGKTNTPEFGFKSSTENLLGEPCKNPWSLDKTPGGSSGGAGCATAAGLSPISIGTDAGGSIRTPASFCGIFGFKPTFGRVPSKPGFGGGHTISHTGPMTRTVADAALAMDIIALPDDAERASVPAPNGSYLRALDVVPRGLKVGFSPNLGYAAVTNVVVQTVERAVQCFKEPGWTVEHFDPGFADPIEPFNTIIRAENYTATGPLMTDHGAELDPGLRDFTASGAGMSAEEYLQAQQARQSVCSSLATYFKTYDLLVTPTLAVPPFKIGSRPTTINGSPIAHSMSWLTFTYPFNLSGHPAASVPCGWTDDGLPIGMQIVGPRFADTLVLQASALFEKLQPWASRRPSGIGLVD